MIHAPLNRLSFALACAVAPALLAQGAMPPPPLMQFVREEVKPGHGAAHAATETAWTRALIRGKATEHYLGMSSLTGTSEALFIMGYASYADYEAKHNELDAKPAVQKEIEQISQKDGEHLSGTRTWLGAYRKELSFGPAVEIGKMRYLRVRTFRVKQGQNAAFEGGLKTAIAAYEKISYPVSFACYEVVAGTGSPTYVLIRPMKSLAEMDAVAAAEARLTEAVGEEGRRTMAKTFGDAVNAVENQLYAFSPKLSFPGPQVTASDPGYWTLKPEKAAK